MTQHTVSLDVESALAPPHRCSACGSDQLFAVPEHGEVTFMCPNCLRSWSFELGVMVPTPREKCSACANGQACPTHAQVPAQRGGPCGSA